MERQKLLYPVFLVILCVAVMLTPASARERFRPLETLVERTIADSVFPGASIAVLYRGEGVFHKAFGKLTYGKTSPSTGTSTIYDLASLTKPFVTTGIIMQLTERDSLDINAPVAQYLPEFARNGKNNVTIKNLLLHNSGLVAFKPFIRSCSTPDEVIEAIDNERLTSPPGEKTIYSDLGFIVLGKVIERITGRSLEENFRVRFAEPLGLHSTVFNPPDSLHYRIAPTEQDTRWTLATPRPLVHDPNAALLGGAAGHAGLFSTTEDLAIFATMLLQKGEYGGIRFFSPSTLHRFTRRYAGSRGLGWDLRSLNGKSSSGQYFSTDSYGHLGFTGTSIWIDPEKDLAVLALTNRVHPSSENKKIRAFRPLLHDTVVTCLELDSRSE